MPYSRQEASENIRRELIDLAEDMRRERNTPAWHALIPLGLGALFGLVLVVVVALVVRML